MLLNKKNQKLRKGNAFLEKMRIFAHKSISNMKLTLPKRIDGADPVTLDSKVWVVIGTNGAGKSSFGRDLMERYSPNVMMISGLRALFISSDDTTPNPDEDEPTRLRKLLERRMLIPRLSDYEKLILSLQMEEFEAAVEFKEAAKIEKNSCPPRTKMDVIQEVWERMFPHNRLIRKRGFIELISAGKESGAYTAGRMSDSEKLVFYLLGAALSAEENALLIVEEPETLLHNSIKHQLWNEIESLRSDCTFVYLTHDIDFATAHSEGQRVWIRAYDADARLWDYALIECDESLPDELYMEVLGSRKPILFIEGTDTNSIDSKLYPFIFPDYLVKPMGGCQKVIETTKAFNQLKDFHMLDSRGIVDRDRRTTEEIAYLRQQHIYVPEVAEVENLLMLEPVIKVVAARLMKDADEVFCLVKENVIRLFEKELDAQVILHAKHQVRKRLELTVDRKVSTMEQLADQVERIRQQIHVEHIYYHIKSQFQSLIDRQDYAGILRVYNQKGMLPQSRLCAICGISNKESYLDLILSILKENQSDAKAIRYAIQQALGAA